MEIKRIFNMSWISLLWFIVICATAFGARHAVDKADIGRFPMDLLAESTSTAEKGTASKMKLEEDKKTLSQQVADGKYGLIQKELFKNPVRRPGVLSYESNSEVPKDTSTNLGGLNKSDIWLAENHLLVLKGGVFPVLETLPEYSKQEWSPIDDYAAPRRPVKLPKHPKVPPPFPVQLTDGGPLQILGTNFTRTLNDSLLSPPYAVPPLEDYDGGISPHSPPQPPYSDSANATAGETPFPGPPFYIPVPGDKAGEGLPPQFQFPMNGGLPPFFDSLPPGSAILPPPNITDQYDEDDLSIYYPPPYSFYYQKDNSTEVPPGPLVPGIVLPPPPDFFSLLKKSSLASTEKPRTTRPSITTPPTTRKVYKTRKPQVTVLKEVTSKPPSRRVKPTYYKTTVPTVVPEVTSKKHQQLQKNKTVSVTILRPVKTTQKPPTVYIYSNDISHKPFAEYGPPPPPSPHKVTVTTTKIPLRAYFSTSSETDTNLVTHIPEKQQYTTRSAAHKQRTNASQFYYYDDAPITNSISTPYPEQNHYVNFTKEYYNINEDSRKYHSGSIVQVQPKYYYLPNKPYTTQRPKTRTPPTTNNFKTHIVQLQEQIQTYQKPPKPYKQAVFEFENQEQDQEEPVYRYQQSEEIPKPVYQYQQPAPTPKPVYQYQQPAPTPPPVYRQPAPTPQSIYQYQQPAPSPKPIYQYEQPVPSSKPVYQYSFEVANYQEQHQRLQQQQQHLQVPHQTVEQRHRQPFRKSPKYSVQIEPAVEITTESPIYQQTPESIYYPENYQDDSQSQPMPPQQFYTNYDYQEQQKYSTVTPHPLEDGNYKVVTANPIYQPYYTKQDKQLFDDITKEYFTTFGKKLATSTTPIPPVEQPGERQVIYTPQENVRIRTNPAYITQQNVKGNILVNFVNQRPSQEYIQYKQKQQQQPYPQVTKQRPQYISSYQNQQQQQENIRQRTPNVQTIRAISIPARNVAGEGKPGSFISYELPGDDGAHFYFLTPQLSQKSDRSDIAYYFSQPSGSQIRRSQTRGV